MSKEKKLNNAENAELEVAATAAESIETKKKTGRFNKRNFKYGTLSVVLTILFIAAIVVVNIIVGLVSERFNTNADLSDAGIYTMDEKAEKFIAGLDKDVTITVLNSEAGFESGGSTGLSKLYKQINEILKNMQKINDHITIEYLMLDQNPNFSAKFTGETLENDYIVVECAETGRYRIIDTNSYITINDYEAYYSAYMAYAYYGASFDQYDYFESSIEQEAISAMMYVSNDDLVRVAFTEGYNELDSTALADLLTDNGYEVETINLTQIDEIDPEIDFVVMYAPTLDVDVEHIEKLDRFLDNGGEFGKNVIYFASAKQPKTPNIDGFLSDWGMAVEYSAIGQSDANYLMSSAMGYFAHYQDILDTNYAGSTYGNGLYTYGADMRPVIQLWDGGARGSIQQEIIMQTYDNAFLVPLDSEEGIDITTAKSGVFNNAIVAHKIHSTNRQMSRLAVFGSDMFAYSSFMQFANSNNGMFLINMFNNICGREEGITISPKSLATSGFDMTGQQANVLAVVLCIVIPVVVIALGIVIWVRRRHR